MLNMHFRSPFQAVFAGQGPGLPTASGLGQLGNLPTRRQGLLGVLLPTVLHGERPLVRTALDLVHD
jgi:hypothetical protein